MVEHIAKTLVCDGTKIGKRFSEIPQRSYDISSYFEIFKI